MKNNYYDRIKKLADERHISIAELVRRVNDHPDEDHKISKNNVFHWNDRSPRADYLQWIADELNVHVSELYAPKKNDMIIEKNSSELNNIAKEDTKSRQEGDIKLKLIDELQNLTLSNDDVELLSGMLHILVAQKHKRELPNSDDNETNRGSR